MPLRERSPPPFRGLEFIAIPDPGSPLRSDPGLHARASSRLCFATDLGNSDLGELYQETDEIGYK